MNGHSNATGSQNQPALHAWLDDWRWPLAVFGASLLFVTVFFWEPIKGAIFQWSNRSAYNHCYLILPISVFLLWDNRHTNAQLKPRAFPPGLVALTGFLLIWILAAAAGIAEGEHFAIVGVIQSLIISIFGWQVYRKNLIAFLYLWLLVPTGTFLLPLLQEIALVQTVFWLELFDIPNFVEGMIVEVPTGRYQIAPGCAGLNFLLSSIALTPLYSYLVYRSAAKRLAAVAAMLVVALIANAIRIFAIIALAEWTDRKIDIVDDHLLYGWGFFALILFGMGWLGLRFEDTESRPAEVSAAIPAGPAVDTRKGWIVGIAALILLVTVPAYYRTTQVDRTGQDVHAEFPQTTGPWQQTNSASQWQASYPRAHAFFGTSYSDGDHSIDLNIAYYLQQIAGRELISEANDPVGVAPWYKIGQRPRTVDIDGHSIQVMEYIISNGLEARLVWHWLWVDGKFVLNTTAAKLMQARVTILNGDRRAAAIVVSMRTDENIEATADIMSEFVSGGFPFDKILAAATTGQ